MDEKAGLLIPWMIFTVFAFFFFAGIGKNIDKLLHWRL